MADESNVAWNSEFGDSLHIATFRDNIICLCPLDTLGSSISLLKTHLENLYGLELDFEQAGRCLTFLEAQVFCNGSELAWSLKNKLLLSQLTDVPSVKRYPHRDEPGAAHVVRGMASSLGGKAVKISTSEADTRSNFSHVMWEFQMKGYPRRWWNGPLKKTLALRVPGHLVGHRHRLTSVVQPNTP